MDKLVFLLHDRHGGLNHTVKCPKCGHTARIADGFTWQADNENGHWYCANCGGKFLDPGVEPLVAGTTIESEFGNGVDERTSPFQFEIEVDDLEADGIQVIERVIVVFRRGDDMTVGVCAANAVKKLVRDLFDTSADAEELDWMPKHVDPIEYVREMEVEAGSDVALDLFPVNAEGVALETTGGGEYD